MGLLWVFFKDVKVREIKINNLREIHQISSVVIISFGQNNYKLKGP